MIRAQRRDASANDGSIAGCLTYYGVRPKRFLTPHGVGRCDLSQSQNQGEAGIAIRKHDSNVLDLKFAILFGSSAAANFKNPKAH
jgi:hypothetical protein